MGYFIVEDDSKEIDEEESEDEGSSDDELVEDDKIAEMDKLNFDFEALPPDSEDVNQIANLLTQTFGVGEFLLQRAKKYADKEMTRRLEKLFSNLSESKVGFVVNERMLHFPAQIAGPTLRALKNDIENDNVLKTLKTFILILKVRFNETSSAASNSTTETAKPKGKAAKKRALADKLSNAEMIYDNEEEMLLFEANDQTSFSYFQYPVHFDVEKQSKFHVVRRNNETYYPYRRVCLLNREQLFEFCDKTMNQFLFLFSLLFLAAFGSLDNWTSTKNRQVATDSHEHSPNVTVLLDDENPQARCYDSRLASYLNTGLSYYAHDMGSLSKYILDQIVRARMSGYWLVHSEMIQNRRQGLEIIEQMSDDVNNISVMNLQGEHSDSSIVPEKTKCRRCRIERDGGEIYVCTTCSNDFKAIFNEMNTILNEADNLIFAMCMKILSNFQRHFRLPNESMELFKHKIAANETVDLHSLLSTSSGLLSDSNNQNYLAELETCSHNCSTPTLASTREFVDTLNPSAQPGSNATICTDEPKNRSNMIDDYEIRRNLWESGIAVEFRLDNADNVFHTAMPYYTILPRREYFPLVLGKAMQFFSNVLGEVENITDAWLEADGIPLKWHHPVGVLFDLHSGAENLPWTVIVKFMGSGRQSSSSTKEFPAEVIRGSREAMKNCFFQTIKEADQLKHKGQAFDAMDSVEHAKLFDSICNGKFDDFWSVNSKLMALDGEGKFGYIPIRFHEKSSFSRYVEYAETPFLRPSYFSVPYRISPQTTYQYMSNEMFAHLVREHVRHQQRIRLAHQQRQQLQHANEPILRGVLHINELRQTPYRRYSHNATVAMTYEEKRRRWKEELKNKMRGQKTPPRQIGSRSNAVGTAGRYYITFNPYSNAKPDDLLATVLTTTTSTTSTPPPPIVITQETIAISNDIEQSVSVSSGIKTRPTSSVRQLLNLNYYDDEFESMDENYNDEPDTTTTTQAPTTTTRLLTTTRPLFTTTRLPSTTEQIIYPIAMQSTTTTRRPLVQPTRSLFGSYEDVDEESDEDEDFVWFKPTRQSATSRSSNGPPTITEDEPTSDPFRIIVHGDQ
ncbi:Autophagy protein 5 [Aphelenchoides besseyi]|nr:Autophagy protein 5 [Aphelenchoides besseyi]